MRARLRQQLIHATNLLIFRFNLGLLLLHLFQFFSLLGSQGFDLLLSELRWRLPALPRCRLSALPHCRLSGGLRWCGLPWCCLTGCALLCSCGSALLLQVHINDVLILAQRDWNVVQREQLFAVLHQADVVFAGRHGDRNVIALLACLQLDLLAIVLVLKDHLSALDRLSLLILGNAAHTRHLGLRDAAEHREHCHQD